MATVMCDRSYNKYSKSSESLDEKIPLVSDTQGSRKELMELVTFELFIMNRQHFNRQD
jgi:hypothetical protein